MSEDLSEQGEERLVSFDARMFYYKQWNACSFAVLQAMMSRNFEAWLSATQSVHNIVSPFMNSKKELAIQKDIDSAWSKFYGIRSGHSAAEKQNEARVKGEVAKLLLKVQKDTLMVMKLKGMLPKEAASEERELDLEKMMGEMG